MKKVILFIISGILFLAIPSTIYLVGKNQELRKRAAPATTLSIAPATTSVRTGETFNVNITIDTADNQVAVAQVKILYDPSVLTINSMINGPLAPRIILSERIDATAGTALIQVGAESNTQPITGTGTIVTLSLTALQATTVPASIRFAPEPDTYINALGEGATNVLIGSTGATVTIQAVDTATSTVATTSATLTPTPTPIPNATSSAQALQILSPTDSETLASDLPTFTGVASPGATITLTIHSTPQDPVVVTADEYGNWVYTPSSPLDPGDHTITALTTDPTTGASQTTTASFVVAAAGDTLEPSTGSAVPAAGNTSVTLIFIGLGLLLFFGGTIIPFVRRSP